MDIATRYLQRESEDEINISDEDRAAILRKLRDDPEKVDPVRA